MKKIQDKGEEYVKNENDRLGRILGKSCTVAVNKKLTFRSVKTVVLTFVRYPF